MAFRHRGLLAAAAGITAFAAFAAGAAERATLFRDVNVITMTDDRVLPHRDVLVRDGRIASITTTGARTVGAADALVVAGEGRYLMPGLAEMHAHLPGPRKEQYGKDILLLFVAHGVTTIRSMLGDPWHLELRSRLERNEMLGPRLFASGPSLNGKSVPDVARAVSIVREEAAAGYDFLKLHPGLSLPVFDTIAKTADARHITFQGHISSDVGVLRALEARQRAIDHLDGYVEELAERKCREAAEDTGFFGASIVQCVDEKRIPELVRRTKAAGTWMVPTEALMEHWADAASIEQTRSPAAVRYMPPEVLAQWDDIYRGSRDAAPLPRERLREFVNVRRAILREMHRQQVPIALGSDAPQIFNVPGDSALEELRVYVDIGLTPYEALRTATVAPAQFFNATDRFGTVREGLVADLILVQRNPLEDISALRELRGVMMRGRWLPREKLDELLEQVAARARG